MKTKGNLLGMATLLLVALVAGGALYAASDLCNKVDMKPVLSLQQVRQAEFVHYLVVLSGLEAPNPEGKTPEQMYAEETKILVDNGYPASLKGIEPDRLVTRRYFATIMYPVACQSDAAFNSKYGGLTDETQQLKALVEADWMFAEEGRLYREEVLSVLCAKKIAISKPPAIEVPVWIPTEGTLEAPLSPM
jgi:hypothetical protein